MVQTGSVKLSQEQLQTIFDAFDGKNVLVIGDVMLDSYWWGRVERISPEAPVPIINVSKREYRLGGAANVALNLVRLGANPIVCAVTGHDAEAGIFQELLQKEGISAQGVVQTESRPTTVKTRVIGNKSQLLRIDSEEDKPLSVEDTERLLQRIFTLLPSADLVIFEDYDKGVITEPLIEAVVKEAVQAKIPVAVDPKKRNFLCYKGVNLFKPNLRELSEGLKLDIDSHSSIEEIEEAAHKLTGKLNVQNALITLSERGVYITDQHGSGYLIPAHIRNIYDVSGAGDTVISVAALAMLAGANMPAVAALANLAGGLVCEKVGVVPIDKEELYSQAVLEFGS